MEQSRRIAREYESELDSYNEEEISLEELADKINREEGIKIAEEIIETIFEEKLFSNMEDRCFECCTLLSDDDYMPGQNPCPYGDTTVYENVSEGYQCHFCGHEEDF